MHAQRGENIKSAEATPTRTGKKTKVANMSNLAKKTMKQNSKTTAKNTTSQQKCMECKKAKKYTNEPTKNCARCI